VATFASFDDNLSFTTIRKKNVHFIKERPTLGQQWQQGAKQDRWSQNVTFGIPVSRTIREADVPDMETKTKGEHRVLKGGGGGGDTYHPAKRKRGNKSEHQASKLQWKLNSKLNCPNAYNVRVCDNTGGKVQVCLNGAQIISKLDLSEFACLMIIFPFTSTLL
jgi:hypothetical protein